MSVCSACLVTRACAGLLVFGRRPARRSTHKRASDLDSRTCRTPIGLIAGTLERYRNRASLRRTRQQGRVSPLQQSAVQGDHPDRGRRHAGRGPLGRRGPAPLCGGAGLEATEPAPGAPAAARVSTRPDSRGDGRRGGPADVSEESAPTAGSLRSMRRQLGAPAMRTTGWGLTSPTGALPAAGPAFEVTSRMARLRLPCGDGCPAGRVHWWR